MRSSRQAPKFRFFTPHVVDPELPFDFVNDSCLLYTLREKIAVEIESFDRGPVALVCSIPPENSTTEFSRVQFTVLAADGAEVTLDGQPVGKVQNGRLEAARELTCLGENHVAIEIKHEGQKRLLARRYVLKRDANLQLN